MMYFAYGLLFASLFGLKQLADDWNKNYFYSDGKFVNRLVSFLIGLTFGFTFFVLIIGMLTMVGVRF